MLQFLFSPRSQFGIATDPDTGTSRSYAGLSWNLFENNGFFGNLRPRRQLRRGSGAEEMDRRALGPPLALHSTFEFGYQLGDQHSLTLSLDHATTPDFLTERNELDNFQPALRPEILRSGGDLAPHRRVVRGLVAAARRAVDVGGGEPVRGLRRQQQMVDAQALRRASSGPA